MNKLLAKEIMLMAKRDQSMRNKIFTDKAWEIEVDQNNTERLKKIVDQYGWPTISLVGPRASQAAWLLVQHADLDLAFQKRCLESMEDIYHRLPKEINQKNIAYLTDRVLVAENKKQIFGTQFYKNEAGEFIPRPIENESTLDERRSKVGLNPFKDYFESMQTVGELPMKK